MPAPEQPQPRPDREGTDPYAGVDARTISQIENDENVRIERDTSSLPVAAQLTRLPLKWIAITLLVCAGVAHLAQRVENRHLLDAAQKQGWVSKEQREQADDAQELYRQREDIQRRLSELKERRRKLQETMDRGGEPPPEEKDLTDAPLTLEALRAEIRERAGDSFDNYRRLGTAVALAFGGLGLILLALFVRVLWAAILGGAAFGATFLMGLEPWIMWSATGAGALLGAWLGPRLLVAGMYSNATLAGLVLGAVAGGGGVYLGTGHELGALLATGAGAIGGAVLGFKFARPLFLSSVLANCAGTATSLLWLLWGDLFPHFWPLTFAGLVVVDGVATRLYHRLRWGQ